MDGKVERSQGFQDTIFEFGPYPFSVKKGTAYLDQIFAWNQFCTGTIINEHWIITAAHCMMSLWEGNYFFVQAGSNDCLLDSHNEYMREVVVNRIQNHEHQSIFEHYNWLSGRGVSRLQATAGFDLALVRLDEPYVLPKGVYNNELVNRICINSYYDFPKTGCLKNVYFSGFGRKDNARDRYANDPRARLTWFQPFRTTPQYCKMVTNQFSGIQEACYSAINRHSNLGDEPRMKEAGVKNLTEVENYPNTCPGDSGGPFIYYMRFDEQADDKYKVLSDGSIQPGYRAILMSTLCGGSGKVPPQGHCEKAYWIEKKGGLKSLFTSSSIYFKHLYIGPMVYNRVNDKFFITSLASTARGYSAKTGEDLKYPVKSEGQHA